MKKIEFASNLEFSTDVITEVIAVVAKRGSGKTYTATKLAEGMLSIGAQTIVIDPVGNWYGLRLGSNGKPDGGMDIKILGGRHGDIPLAAASGSLVAQTLVETGMSAILDLTMMTKAKQRRFVTEFSEALLEKRKHAPAAMHIFWEEAYRFMPQKMAKGSKNEMLEATEELVTMGRNFGIGGTIICQRAAQVSKTCLTQASILVAMNTIGADRKVILDWIDHKGMDKESKETTKLSDLKRGQAFVWWPEEFGIVRVKVAKKKTYDASSTPKFGDKTGAKKLKTIDLGALEASMAETIEKAKSEDPRLLRRKIAELEKKILELSKAKPTTPTIDKKLIEQVSRRIGDEAKTIRKAVEWIEGCQPLLAKALQEVPKPHLLDMTSKAEWTKKMDKKGLSSVWRPSDAPPPVVNLKGGAHRMLVALCTFHPGSMTKKQVAKAANMKPTSGTFSTYWSKLSVNGLIRQSEDGRWSATEKGIDHLGLANVPNPPDGPEELLEFWCERLKGREADILRYLFISQCLHSKEEIGDAVGLSHTSGTFSTYMSTLTANGLAKRMRNDGITYYTISEDFDVE